MPIQSLPVFYNLDTVTIGPISSTNSAITQIKSPSIVSNLKIDEQVFYMTTMYIYRPTGTPNTQTYFVIEMIDDPNKLKGKRLYLVAEIKYGGTRPAGTTSLPLDTLLAATSVEPASSTWLINDNIVDAKTARMFEDPTDGSRTIILNRDFHSIVTKDASISVDKCYTSGLANIILSSNTIPAQTVIMRKSIIDWNINCELQGEDEDSNNSIKVDADITPYSILLTMTSIAGIAAALYSTTPSIFRSIIIPLAKEYNNGGLALFSISVVWNIVLGLIILQLFIFGLTGASETFFYLFFGALIIWFLCNKAVKDNFGSLQIKQNPLLNGLILETSFMGMFNKFEFDLSRIIMIVAGLMFAAIYFTAYGYLTTDKIAKDKRISVFFFFFATMISSVFLILISNAVNKDTEYGLIYILFGLAIVVTGLLFGFSINYAAELDGK
jgi:MFS family permease